MKIKKRKNAMKPSVMTSFYYITIFILSGIIIHLPVNTYYTVNPYNTAPSPYTGPIYDKTREFSAIHYPQKSPAMLEAIREEIIKRQESNTK